MAERSPVTSQRNLDLTSAPAVAGGSSFGRVSRNWTRLSCSASPSRGVFADSFAVTIVARRYPPRHHNACPR
ncbi:hypothetical protein CMEL01_00432 [Colletotrichum melonis]|uniref:Uncharacterized protein n=1 Tax=Colletotrichum melonis TaxID=1209925 RepID=A0AAI9V3I3_9PEZI|nr:hypothetical protein CMEL01_00432 [Colletotrichum melonis]